MKRILNFGAGLSLSVETDDITVEEIHKWMKNKKVIKFTKDNNPHYVIDFSKVVYVEVKNKSDSKWPT